MKLSMALLFLCSPLFAKQGVYVIGEDSEKKEVVFNVNPHNLKSSLEEALDLQSVYALNALNASSDQSQWKLKKFTIGLGVEGEAGIGPWNLGLAIKQRLVFKKNSKEVK